MKKAIGYVLLVLSVVPWAVIALLPFLEISRGQIAAATTVLLVSGEVAFLAALTLLGKEAWQHIKAIFKQKKKTKK